MIQKKKPISWQDMKDCVQIGERQLIGAKFKFIYSSGRFCLKPFVASYDGEDLMVNCHFGKDAQGNVDKSVIIVPIDYQNLTLHKDMSPIKVRREWYVKDSDYADGYNNIVTEEMIEPSQMQDVYSTVVINAMRGNDGADGTDGADGADGKSAYEIAVENGFEGTEAEWLESLKYKPTPEEQEESEQHAIEMATAAAVAAANAVIEQQAGEIATLKARVDELSAADGSESSETPEIDSQKEVTDFLDGIDNSKKLKDMLSGEVNEDDEELVFG